MRKLAVPPRYSSTVVAEVSEASIFPQRVRNSARVMSLVQHVAVASVPASASAGTNGEVHFAARSVAWARTFLRVLKRCLCEGEEDERRVFTLFGREGCLRGGGESYGISVSI